jgi:hypothetical protein
MEAAIDWNSRCRPPLDEAEIHRVVTDLSEKDRREALAVEASWEALVPLGEGILPPFPVDTLPIWLGEFVVAVAEDTQTPVDMAAMLALATIGASVAKTVVVRAKETYFEPTNLFVVVSMPPGNRKSAVFAAVTRPMKDYEAALVEKLKPELAQSDSEARIRQARLDKLESDAAKEMDPDKQKALNTAATELAKEIATAAIRFPPRLVVEDVTAERLTTLLMQNGGRLAIMSSEGGLFELIAGRYSKNSEPNLDVFLKAHSGEDLRVDRVNRPPDFVREPALSMGQTVQPAVIRGMAKAPGFRGRGLLGRILYSNPKSLVGRRKPDGNPVPAPVSSLYHDRVTRLIGLQPAAGPRPHELQLAPAARKAWLDFGNWLEPQLDEFGALGSIADWASKLQGAALRIAGILHMADQSGTMTGFTPIIAGPVMDRAVRIGKYLIDHAKAAFNEMGADPVVEAARMLLKWIEKHSQTKFSKKEAFDGIRGRFQKSEDLNPAIKVLVEHGYIRERKVPERKGSGRKPSPVYEVNPVVHNRCKSAPTDPEINLADTAESRVRSIYESVTTYDEQGSGLADNNPPIPLIVDAQVMPMGGESHLADLAEQSVTSISGDPVVEKNRRAGFNPQLADLAEGPVRSIFTSLDIKEDRSTVTLGQLPPNPQNSVFPAVVPGNELQDSAKSAEFDVASIDPHPAAFLPPVQPSSSPETSTKAASAASEYEEFDF